MQTRCAWARAVFGETWREGTGEQRWKAASESGRCLRGRADGQDQPAQLQPYPTHEKEEGFTRGVPEEAESELEQSGLALGMLLA